MEEIIKQMLAAEGKAKRIAADAEAEAAKIIDAARNEAENVHNQAIAEARTRSEQLIQERRAAAQEEKTRALEGYTLDLEQQKTQFMQQAPQAAQVVRDILLNPDM